MQPKAFKKRKPFAVVNNYDPDAVIYFNTVTARGGTVSPARKQKISDGIAYLKLQGQWNLLDRLTVYVNSSQVAALTSIVNPTAPIAIAMAAPTFTAEAGYIMDGATQYIKSGFIPSTSGVNYTLKNMGFGGYSPANLVVGNHCLVGCSDLANDSFIFPGVSGVGMYYWLNSGTGGAFARTGNTPGNYYVGGNNGTTKFKVPEGSSSDGGMPMTGLPGVEFYYHAYNNNGSPSTFLLGAAKWNFLGSYNLDFDILEFAMANYFLT